MTLLMFPKSRLAPYAPPETKRRFNWRLAVALFINFLLWAGAIYAALALADILSDALSR